MYKILVVPGDGIGVEVTEVSINGHSHLIDILHLPIFTEPHLAETVKHFAEIGTLLLLFFAGLQLHLDDLMKAGKISCLKELI